MTICCFNDERLLLARHAAAQGQWVTPGGAVEPGEDVADAAVREAEEELGVTVVPTDIVGVFGPHRVVYPNGDVTFYVTTMFAVEVVSGNLAADQRELLELGWFEEREVANLDVASWLRPLLPDIFGWRRDGRTRFLGSVE